MLVAEICSSTAVNTGIITAVGVGNELSMMRTTTVEVVAATVVDAAEVSVETELSTAMEVGVASDRGSVKDSRAAQVVGSSPYFGVR